MAIWSPFIQEFFGLVGMLAIHGRHAYRWLAKSLPKITCPFAVVGKCAEGYPWELLGLQQLHLAVCM